MLAADVEKTGAELGEPLPLAIFETLGVEQLGLPRPALDEVVVVGSYVTPGPGDGWLIPGRLTSTNEQESLSGGYQPYAPAPLITTDDTVTAVGEWNVRVDTELDVRADLTPEQLDEAASSATVVPRDVELEVEGGTLRADDTNSLADVVEEVRFQQSTARSSIAPAVLSLVLVALALLMRLLNAASELRVPELALASLRGVTARRLWGLGLAEPMVVLLIATPLGIAFGLGLVGRAGAQLARAGAAPAAAVGQLGRRRPRARSRPSRSRASRSGWWSASRWPPSSAAYDVRWPHAAGRSSPSSPWSRSPWRPWRASSPPADRASPTPPTSSCPVLLAVVAGLAATRLTAVVATWWTGRSRGRSLSGFVSWRAISRRQEGTLVILPITAAIAVAVFGAGVYDSAATWRTSVAATASPADTTWSTVAHPVRGRRPHPAGRPRRRLDHGGGQRHQPRRQLLHRRQQPPRPGGDLARHLEPGPRRRAGGRRHRPRRRGPHRHRQAALAHDRQPGRHGSRPGRRGPLRQPQRPAAEGLPRAVPRRASPRSRPGSRSAARAVRSRA